MPPRKSTGFSLSMEMSRLTRDGTAEPVSRDQILRRERGQGRKHFSVQLATSWIGKLTRLIHAVSYYPEYPVAFGQKREIVSVGQSDTANKTLCRHCFQGTCMCFWPKSTGSFRFWPLPIINCHAGIKTEEAKGHDEQPIHNSIMLLGLGSGSHGE